MIPKPCRYFRMWRSMHPWADPGGAYRNPEFADKSGYQSSAQLWRESDLVVRSGRHPRTSAAVPAEEAEKLAELKELNLPCAMIGEVIDRQEYALQIR